MSKKKVESILSWKAPRSVKDVQISIVFAKFYWRFIENFSKVCKPITDTLKTKGDKKLWSWGPEQDKAFEELKQRYTLAPILAHFYSNRKTVIETDASDFALGCILSQYLGKLLHQFCIPLWEIKLCRTKLRNLWQGAFSNLGGVPGMEALPVRCSRTRHSIYRPSEPAIFPHE